MRFRRLAAAALSAIFVTGAATSCSVNDAPPNLVDSVVKVILPDSIGSGVYIDGYIITAAHVVEDAKFVSIKASDGKQSGAEVLWSNNKYDIALLRTDAKMASAALDCRMPVVGEEIVTVGNPSNVEFVSAFGHIAGAARKVGSVELLAVTDITTVMGQSGGPVFDKNGKVVGINSRAMVARLQDRYGQPVPTLARYGFIVPSSVVCMLMGRAEV